MNLTPQNTRGVLSILAAVAFYALVGVLVWALAHEGTLIASEAFAILGLALNPVSLAFGFYFAKDEKPTDHSYMAHPGAPTARAPSSFLASNGSPTTGTTSIRTKRPGPTSSRSTTASRSYLPSFLPMALSW